MRARKLLIKAAFLFLILEVLLVYLPLPLSPASAYGVFRIKRERFPLSTVPPVDEALDVGNLDAMFASHVVSDAKPANEFRVLVLGDSTIWGLQLTPDEVLPGQLNHLGLLCRDKTFRFYNLSFPRSSATKDIMILDRALQEEPDAIIWLITWYTLMPKTRVDHWIVEQNPQVFQRLGRRFDFLARDNQPPSWWDVAFDRHRRLFRAARFQLYTVVSLATSRDQIAGRPQAPATELSSDLTFEGIKPPTLRRNQVSLDQIGDLHDLADHVPVLLVNEPILRMTGIPNSDVRYNSYYPRWIYDQYRAYLSEAVAENGWSYLDLWDMFPAEYFADTPLHLVPDAHRQLAQRLVPEIQGMCR